MMSRKVKIIGAGLAGSEAAWQLARRGVEVELYEMRPLKMTPAHETGYCAEMVCSNSLGSEELSSSSGLLKAELRLLNSFILKKAEQFRVPAGRSLAVDRLEMARAVSAELEKLPGLKIIREEYSSLLKEEAIIILATGPLTSEKMAEEIARLTWRKNLFFYDATSPLIAASSIDFSKLYQASRYNKGEKDFWNIPLDREQYQNFVHELINGQVVELKEFEKDLFFEACLPIEEIARRGEQTLAFGPLKPIGLEDPRSKTLPYAVVQLRADNLKQDLMQLVGFQTRLKWTEQKRIFSMLPGLKNAEFVRYGRMHRNTYINAPLILNSFSQMKKQNNIFFSGQISGVEGYVESIASGLLTALFSFLLLENRPLNPLPAECACGALLNYLAYADWQNFRPTKFNFGLLTSQNRKIHNKKAKKEWQAEQALQKLKEWASINSI